MASHILPKWCSVGGLPLLHALRGGGPLDLEAEGVGWGRGGAVGLKPLWWG